WAALPGILPLSYERIAFETEAVAREIADQIGVAVDPAAVAVEAKGRFTQFNKGRPHRHREEMAAEDAARYGAEFAAFIARWC
ncbi:MAG: hypothetical protein AAFW69_10820, partial [Pseudomonadota bacterium]